MAHILTRYLRGLYSRTMAEAYGHAYRQLDTPLAPDDLILDCGAGAGHTYQKLTNTIRITQNNYRGLEWDKNSVAAATAKGLQVSQADLNDPLPFADNTFAAVIGLSVLEHLLKPCHYLRECHRVLRPGGRLVILTPNIATYFTAALIILGRMPSSGPHPDSEQLVSSRTLTTLAKHLDNRSASIEGDSPLHRHLVVFSYTDLKRFLRMAGFAEVAGRGFGVYPFPNLMQPMMERIDRRHAHQMVFTALK